jgi:hypothetical protein
VFFTGRRRGDDGGRPVKKRQVSLSEVIIERDERRMLVSRMRIVCYRWQWVTIERDENKEGRKKNVSIEDEIRSVGHVQ